MQGVAAAAGYHIEATTTVTAAGGPDNAACNSPADTAAELASLLVQEANPSLVAIAQAPCCPGARTIAERAWPALQIDILNTTTQGKRFKVHTQLMS